MQPSTRRPPPLSPYHLGLIPILILIPLKQLVCIPSWASFTCKKRAQQLKRHNGTVSIGGGLGRRRIRSEELKREKEGDRKPGRSSLSVNLPTTCSFSPTWTRDFSSISHATCELVNLYLIEFASMCDSNEASPFSTWGSFALGGNLSTLLLSPLESSIFSILQHLLFKTRSLLATKVIILFILSS